MAPTKTPVAAGPTSGSSVLPNSGNKQSSAAQKPVRRSRVEPVIPLPFLQRRPKATSNGTPLPASPSPLRINNENTPPTLKTKSDEVLAPRSATTTPISIPVAPAEAAPDVSKGALTENEVAPAPPAKTEDEDSGVTSVEPDNGPSIDHALAIGVDTNPRDTSTTLSQTPGDTTPPDTALSAPSSASFAPPVTSPPPSNMRPPFHPAGAHTGSMHGPVPEPIRLPSHPFNQPRIHQHHHSNGSLVFGGFQGSNTSSPIPHSGGVFPPPMPMSHEPVPVTGIDSFGRPVLATAPIDTHGPIHMNHGPLTPHSFHGSQSSRNEDFNGKPVMNGMNGDITRNAPPPTVGQASFHANQQAQPSFSANKAEVDAAMDFTEYIASLFARPEFADCDVVLLLPDRLSSINSQYPGTPNGPLRLPAHQLILSHNPLLREVIHKLGRQGDGPREVRIASDDPFLRADAMWRAIQHLYGSRYTPLPLHIQKQSDIERFHFALGYAAAGARLEIPHVSSTAVKEASMLLNWDTVEKGLEFALLGLQLHPERSGAKTHPFPFFRYKHGAFIADLVEKILLFIITQFPDNFILDSNVDDPRYARLPTYSTEAPRSPTLNGPTNHIHAGQSASRMASINIKFGDMEPNENGYGSAGPAQSSTGRMATLSRILLNLPFEMLKMVLESNGLGGVDHWHKIQERRRFMSDVIAGREARRLRLTSELTTGAYQGPIPVEGLRSQEPRLLEGNWSNVCWKEECLPSPDVAMIGRQWVPVSGEL